VEAATGRGEKRARLQLRVMTGGGGGQRRLGHMFCEILRAMGRLTPSMTATCLLALNPGEVRMS
jgi:hypothetical protein